MSSAPALLTAYLMVGADELKRQDILARLTRRVAELGDVDFNLHVFDAEQGATAEEVIEAANTLPFMCEKRLVVVKNVERFAKDEVSEIVNYLADPCQSTVMALTAKSLASNTRLYKAVAAISKTAVISCAPKKQGEMASLVVRFAQTHGVEMDADAARALIDLVGNDTVALDNETRKLASVALGAGKQRITARDVSAGVARIAEVKPWDVTRALSERDAREMALLISRMDDSRSWTGLLYTCVARLRELIIAKTLAAQGRTGELFSQVKAINPRVQEWQLRDHLRYASRFEAQELRHLLVDAAEAERKMKSGADARLAFELWAMRACGAGSA